MKTILLTFCIALLFTTTNAQLVISGMVTDKNTNQPLPGATVQRVGSFHATVTDATGNFTLSNVPKGHISVKIRFLGYKEQVMELHSDTDNFLSIQLIPSPILSDEIVITSTRADKNSGVAYSEIDKAEIQSKNTGRDLPYLIDNTPSLITTSDAGTGIGYTGVRIRGTDASRINVTIDGIPINDAESQNLYWVNMPDLSSSIENIQVQRGVGTSTNGASAFGGSLNIKTALPSDKPFLNTSTAVGSFNTLKTNASIGTGMIDNKWNFEGRLSKIKSDGFIDRASSDLKSFFISGRYYGKKNSIKMNVFSGKEITYQSWYGVPEASLDTNRTWNYYTYENQVDNYQQDHYQLFYIHELTSQLKFNTAFHYTYGRGFYEEFAEGALLSDYSLADVISGNDTISSTNLIRQKWLDNDFYGATWSLFYNPSEKKNFILGGAYNEYKGDHFGKVIWAQYASNGNIRHRYYDNDGFKTDFNIYLKGTSNLIGKLSLSADVQYRKVKHEFNGLDALLNEITNEANYNFFNPKVALTYSLTDGQQVYISFAIGNKEPSRDDLVQSTIDSRPKHETLSDIECGYFIRKEKYMIGFNYYLMMYENQLILTGAINDVGNYTRTNVKKSSREGVELEMGWNPISRLTLNGNVTISKNKIDEFREYTDDYDLGVQELQIYKNTDIAFSPDLTAFLNVSGKITKHLEASIINKYVGKQFLDNTSSTNKMLDAYLLNDFQLNWIIKPKFMKEIRLTAMINNLLDVKYESNGYTFSYIYGGEKIHENYYYPQAGRNFMMQVTLKF